MLTQSGFQHQKMLKNNWLRMLAIHVVFFIVIVQSPALLKRKFKLF